MKIHVAVVSAQRSVLALSIVFSVNVMASAGAQSSVQSTQAKSHAVSSAADTAMLSKADAAKLALYTANHEPVVVLAVAARRSQNAEVAAAVKRYGGRVDYRLDTIDYMAAVLPTRMIPSFLAEPGLQAVAVENLNEDYAGQFLRLLMDGKRELNGPTPDTSSNVALKLGKAIPVVEARAPKLPPRPMTHPHSILRDMDGEAFRQRDPRFDGRGVVIAHIEDFPDFLLPEMQVAKDASGKDIPKFVDVINIPAPAVSLDPNAPRRGDRWTTRLSKPVASNGLTLTSGSKTFRLPKAGTYRLAQFELPSNGWGRTAYPHVRKVHASAKTLKDGAPLLLDVLWSEREERLWIDSNGNGDFSDEQGVGDYRTSHQFGVFGEDDPVTEIRESAAYAVQADGDYIGINLAYSTHATAVAGAAAASRGKGLVDGVAPGAQLIAINGHSNDSVAAYARAMATAYVDPRVDVVHVQGNKGITIALGPNDGRSLLGIVLSRLVERYRKPTLVTANNSPWMSAIMDFTIPQNVLSVGASQSAASLSSYYGIKSRHEQDLHFVGSEGPSGDGALKPDILAPANPVSVFNRDQWEAFRSIYPGVFRLPVGYMICGGTSCATPVAAGAAALLVGAARLNGLPTDAEAIHEALRNTASFMSHVSAYKQGRGILRIDAAWRYLNAQAKDKEHYDIDVAAPVRTVWSDTLPRPHTGRGLFEREGWRAGMRQERVILLTRRSGPKEPVRFAIAWQGNDGAFTSSDSISLPLNKSVPLKVTIAVNAPGVYSAIALLSHPSQLGAAASIPVTIVVPYEFTAEHNFSWSGQVLLDRPAGRRNLFFRVPEGAKVFNVTMDGLRKGLLLRVLPPHNPNALLRAGTAELTSKSELTIEAPAPGVWEVVLHDPQDSHEFDWLVAGQDYLPSTKIEISAKILGASATVQEQEVWTENRLSAFDGGITNMGLGGLRSTRATLTPRQPLVYDIDVEQGQELLVAEIDRFGGANFDADLHLFDCTRGTCAISRRSDKRGAHERVVVERPTSGKWKVVVLASGAEQGAMELTYADYYTHPKLGTLSTTDAPQKREPGEIWQAKLNIWRVGKPRQGYKPTGVIRIMDSDLRVQLKEDYAPGFGSLFPSRVAYLELKPFLLEKEPSKNLAQGLSSSSLQ